MSSTTIVAYIGALTDLLKTYFDIAVAHVWPVFLGIAVVLAIGGLIVYGVRKFLHMGGKR